MIKIGITGGIGVGKTYVSNILNKMSYPSFNADLIAKKCVKENKFLQESLIENFGEEVFIENNINKEFLKNIIFNNSKALKKINSIIHPYVNVEFDLWCKQQNSSIIFKEAAILFETGANKKLDFIICVSSNLDLRIKRIKKRDNKSTKDIMKIIDNQMDQSNKEDLSDFIINNNENQSLLLQIQNILDTINEDS